MLRNFSFCVTIFLDRWNFAKRRIELTGKSSQQIHSARYQVRPKAKKFERAQNDKMLLQKVIKPVRTEWTIQMVFAQKKNQLLRLSAEDNEKDIV